MASLQDPLRRVAARVLLAVPALPAAALLAVLLFLVPTAERAFQNGLEPFLYRTHAAWIGGAHEQLSLVLITDEDLARLGAWPLPRYTYTRLLRRLAPAGPRAVALDVLFLGSTEDDAGFLDAAAEMPAVVLPSLLVADQVLEKGDLVLRLRTDEPFEGAGPESLARGFANAGIFGLNAGGFVHRVPLSLRSQGQISTSFASAIASAGRGEGASAASGVESHPVGWRRLRASEVFPGQRIPRGAEELVLDVLEIDFTGLSRSDAFQTHTLLEVLEGRAPESAFRNRIVLLGAEAAGTTDIKATPVGARAGVHILAQAVANLLEGGGLRRWSPSVSVAAALLASVCMSLLWRTMRPGAAALLLLGSGLALTWTLFGMKIVLPALPFVVLPLSILATNRVVRFAYGLRPLEEGDSRSEPSQPVPGQQIVRASIPERFLDLTWMGQGGMAQVYRARDSETDQVVALKVMSAAFSGDRKMVSRFAREAEAAASLRHPNIVTVHEASSGELPYFTMELLPGPTLRERIEEEGRLSVPDVMQVFLCICRALAYAHDRGIIHRDVKPGNVMLGKEGEWKLLDFGLALVTDSTRLTMSGQALGSPWYMAPEQLLGESVEPAADVFSLGVTIFESLAGRLPFVGSPQAVLSSSAPSLRLLVEDVPEWLDELVAGCLTRAPQDRYGHARSVLEVLETHRKAF